MRIIVKKAGQMPEVREVENDLGAFQEIVGGHIECVGVYDNILCVCNEEGKLQGLSYNFILHGDMIVGDVFFCSFGGEDFESLSDEDTEMMMNVMTHLEVERMLWS